MTESKSRGEPESPQGHATPDSTTTSESGLSQGEGRPTEDAASESEDESD